MLWMALHVLHLPVELRQPRNAGEIAMTNCVGTRRRVIASDLCIDGSSPISARVSGLFSISRNASRGRSAHVPLERNPGRSYRFSSEMRQIRRSSLPGELRASALKTSRYSAYKSCVERVASSKRVMSFISLSSVSQEAPTTGAFPAPRQTMPSERTPAGGGR